jgi:pyrroline-5-carboxylate reductase
MWKKISVALIGAGSMGGALLRGWLDKNVIDCAASAVFDPAPAPWLPDASARHGLKLNPQIDASRYDAVVIAVKPQMAANVLPEFSSLAADTLAISVMAGKALAGVTAALSGARKIVRAMPNLPAAVGAGVTAIYAPDHIDARDRDVSETLMRAVGDVIWVDDEAAIDAVTAISGSGPAYFFLLGEALAEAALALGLSEGASTRLARATLTGAGAYAAHDARTLAELRKAVTSQGGTTQAALKVLDGDSAALRALIRKAAEAARDRAAEMTS